MKRLSKRVAFFCTQLYIHVNYIYCSVYNMTVEKYGLNLCLGFTIIVHVITRHLCG